MENAQTVKLSVACATFPVSADGHEAPGEAIDSAATSAVRAGSFLCNSGQSSGLLELCFAGLFVIGRYQDQVFAFSVLLVTSKKCQAFSRSLLQTPLSLLIYPSVVLGYPSCSIAHALAPLNGGEIPTQSRLPGG